MEKLLIVDYEEYQKGTGKPPRVCALKGEKIRTGWEW